MRPPRRHGGHDGRHEAFGGFRPKSQLQFPAFFGPDFPPFDWDSSQLTGFPVNFGWDGPGWPRVGRDGRHARRNGGRHGRHVAVMAAVMPPAVMAAVMAASTASSRKPISVEIQLQFPAVFGPDFPPFDWISSQLTGNPSQIAVDRPEWAPKGPIGRRDGRHEAFGDGRLTGFPVNLPSASWAHRGL